MAEPAQALQLFVPGRLCLFGEHSDWAGGYRTTHPSIRPGSCLVTGTDQGLTATVTSAETLDIATVLPDGGRRGPEVLPLVAASLARAARTGGFFSYAAGTAAVMCERHSLRRGARIRVTENDLPKQKGLSSSAAVCVLTARALAAVNDIELTVREAMDVAFEGERRAFSRCGRMDQICAYGQRPTLLSFDGDDLEIEPLLAAGALYFLVVDLQRSKDTRRILDDLNSCFPDTPGARPAAVRHALGDGNLALIGHARAALVAGDGSALGALMTEAQALFDDAVAPACPELEAPRLHEILADGAVGELAWGGKGVGSGGDGCAQLTTRGPDERDELRRHLEQTYAVHCLDLTIEPRPGPDEAAIPAAGAIISH